MAITTRSFHGGTPHLRDPFGGPSLRFWRDFGLQPRPGHSGGGGESGAINCSHDVIPSLSPLPEFVEPPVLGDLQDVAGRPRLHDVLPSRATLGDLQHEAWFGFRFAGRFRGFPCNHPDPCGCYAEGYADGKEQAHCA